MLLRKKEEIEAWLNKYDIKYYTLINSEEYGYIVNVNEGVDLFNKKLTNIKVKFNEIKGDFNCSNNELVSLKGCPEIINGNFACKRNNLKNLKNGPKMINGGYWCQENNLISLEGISSEINDYFNCSYNKLDIQELQKLCNIKYLIEVSLFNNLKLGDFQKIKFINEIQETVEMLKIKEDKENLLNLINQDYLNNKQNINKI